MLKQHSFINKTMAQSAGDANKSESSGMDEGAAREGNTQRLYVHVLRRGFELGAFGGIVIGVPLLIRKRQANLAAQGVPILTAALQRIGSSALWTSAATGLASVLCRDACRCSTATPLDRMAAPVCALLDGMHRP